MIWASFDFSERVGCKIFATDIRINSAIIKVLDKEVLGFSGPTLGTGEEEEEEEELGFLVTYFSIAMHWRRRTGKAYSRS